MDALSFYETFLPRRKGDEFCSHACLWDCLKSARWGGVGSGELKLSLGLWVGSGVCHSECKAVVSESTLPGEGRED